MRPALAPPSVMSQNFQQERSLVGRNVCNFGAKTHHAKQLLSLEVECVHVEKERLDGRREGEGGGRIHQPTDDSPTGGRTDGPTDGRVVTCAPRPSVVVTVVVAVVVVVSLAGAKLRAGKFTAENRPKSTQKSEQLRDRVGDLLAPFLLGKGKEQIDV